MKRSKAQRLESELGIIKYRRRQVLSFRYQQFQHTLHPSQWKYLPRTLEIAEFEAFAQHIEADAEIEVAGSTFDDAFSELPNLLVVATEQRKATLLAQMDDNPRDDGEIKANSLDLATAAFTCAEVHSPYAFRYLFGWDEIASHHCLAEREGLNDSYLKSLSSFRTTPIGLEFNPEIANVVSKLAQLTGLNSATATAADFDRKNLRFSCNACSCFKAKGQYYRVGYTWRNFVGFPFAVDLMTNCSWLNRQCI